MIRLYTHSWSVFKDGTEVGGGAELEHGCLDVETADVRAVREAILQRLQYEQVCERLCLRGVAYPYELVQELPNKIIPGSANQREVTFHAYILAVYVLLRRWCIFSLQKGEFLIMVKRVGRKNGRFAYDLPPEFGRKR